MKRLSKFFQILQGVKSLGYLHILALMLLVFTSTQFANAVVYNVNSTDEIVEAPADVGDGVCDVDGLGTCTIRAAFRDANNRLGIDTINIPDGLYVLTLGGNPDLNITDDLFVNGSGPDTIIDGNGTSRIFNVATGVTTVISDLTIQNGVATGPSFDGGGILNSGILTLNNSTVRDNEATSAVFGEGRGGGIRNNSGANLTVNECAIINNAAQYGGGLHVDDSTATVTNTTFTDNEASVGFQLGAAIRNFNTGTLDLINVTVGDNPVGNAAVSSDGTSTTNLEKTLIANTAGTDCAGTTLVSMGHNIDTDNTCNLIMVSDMPNTSALALQLGPLDDNGGDSMTHALLEGSVAIDAIAPADCPLPNMDQRGEMRPADGDDDGDARCDIGAYEFQPASDSESGGGCSLAPKNTGTGFSLLSLLPMLVLAGRIIRRKYQRTA